MQKILFIEKSATLRHAMGKLLLRHGYEADIADDFDSGLAQLVGTDTEFYYDGIILGWPSQTHTSTDELLTTLTEYPYAHLPLLALPPENKT